MSVIELLANRAQLPLFELPDRGPAPAVGCPDHRRAHQFRHGPLAESVQNDLHPTPFLENEPLQKIRGADHLSVPERKAVKNELDDAFAEMARQRAQGVVVAQDPITLSSRGQVVMLAARRRLPAMYALKEFPEVGGLMSYGPNIADQFRRAAAYVDKILKGAKPGDLPVDQAIRFEFVINLKTAKALSFTIAPSLLARADRVIE